MGEHDIRQGNDDEARRGFTRRLLADVRALERMIEENLIESDVRRIGAEQEVFLIDGAGRPAPLAIPLLESIDDPHFTTELGRYNLEFNLDPVCLAGNCLRQMETQLEELLARARAAAREMGLDVALIGILPTIEPSDLHLGNMTPIARYYALNEAMNRLRGGHYDLRIKGRDELILRHDNVMLESCNTSFQVHFQVTAEDFARKYNIAQAVAAPVLACATNSPLLLGRQLWRETRIALFQQSIDTRQTGDALRQSSPRVSFGRQWVQRSALEIFQEDIARFRVLMSGEVGEEPFEVLARGEVPDLAALRLHNGTIYRWNRPCYGISDGKPHLRIENRVLPSGPTPRDEMANAAFWFGLMSGIAHVYDDITRVMEFDTARENFLRAARLGLAAQLEWPGRGSVAGATLILDELLPLARRGLDALGIDNADRDLYLDVIEGRVRSGRTGAQWQIESYDGMREGTRSEQLGALVCATRTRLDSGRPVHEWELATLAECEGTPHHFSRVEQLMTTDLFTVSANELVDMAAHVMNWRHIRHVPVEDRHHRLVGLVTHRALLRLLIEQLAESSPPPTPVSAIMQTELVTCQPGTPTREALDLMRRHKISCLPVVTPENRLVGIVTERDFMGIAGQLLDRFLASDE